MKDKDPRAPGQAKAQLEPAGLVPAYEPPQITTYTDEEILEEMGPAQAVTGAIDP